MSNDSVQVTIGGDASQLLAALAIANAQLGQTQAQMRRLATEMVQTGKAADQGLRAQLGNLGVAAAAVKDHIAELDKQLNGFGPAAAAVDDGIAKIAKSMKSLDGGGGGGGHSSGPGRIIFEIHALADELLSGRVHQAMGTFSNFSYILYGMSPAFAAAAVGAVGLGVAVYETAKYFHDIKATQDAIVQGLAYSGNFGILDPKAVEAVAEKLRSLKGIFSGIGESDVRKIAVEFAQMGDVSSQVVDAMALAMSTMWQQFGTDEKDAAKNIVEVFSKPLAPIDEIAKHLHGLTDEERARLKAAQDTASPLLAQAAILNILAQRERNANAARAQGLRDQIAAQQQVVDEIAKQDGASSASLHDQTDYLNSLKEQLATLDKIGDSLQSQADKMKSMLEPAQNIANALRDWTKKADPKAAAAENVDEEIKKGEAALERMRKASATSGGESPFGGLINSDDYAKASAALESLKAKREAALGKDERKDVELQNLQDEANGQANALREAQRLAKQSADEFARFNKPASDKGEAAELYKDAYQRKLDDEKKLAEAKRAYSLSQATLDEALAGKSVAARTAAELRANAIKKQGAGDDPTKLNDVAAERARIEQTLREDQIAKAANALDIEMDQVRENAAEKVKAYQDDVRQHRLTAQQGADEEKVVLDQEATDLKAMFDRKAALYVADSNKRGEIERQSQKELRAIHAEEDAEQRAAADATAKAWESGAQDVLSAWNSNLRGLLSGTENFGTALRKTVADLVLQLIEGFEKFAVNAVLQYTIVQHAATASSAIQVAANETAASGGMGALIGNAVKAVTIDAGQTFAGVAAFLSPFLGPAALGPAAAAEATVMGAVASADIGMWQVPNDRLALVHHNELIMPAAQAGAFRDMLSNGGGSGGQNVSVNPSTHFHVSAVDGASVSQFFRNNQRGMMRAVDEAVRHGAHLGLRRIAPA